MSPKSSLCRNNTSSLPHVTHDVALISFSILQVSLNTAEPGGAIVPLVFQPILHLHRFTQLRVVIISGFSTLSTKSLILFQTSCCSARPHYPLPWGHAVGMFRLGEELVYHVKFHFVRFDHCANPDKNSRNLGSAIPCDHYPSLFCVPCKYGEQASQWQMPSGPALCEKLSEPSSQPQSIAAPAFYQHPALCVCVLFLLSLYKIRPPFYLPP